MSSKKNTGIVTDLSTPYEQNEIGLRGIIWFGVGLFLLIVVTFLLMWALLNVLTDYNRENAGPVNPLAMSEIERLPPEPRLQGAPGFGVESERGRDNLELMEPQAEYRVLVKQWDDVWEHGTKDKNTGTVITIPIEAAKELYLNGNIKSRTGAAAYDPMNRAHKMMGESSSGRITADRTR